MSNFKRGEYPLTSEMKYIKWPKKGQVFKEMIAVILVSLSFALVIAAGDEVGVMLMKTISKLF